MNQSIDPNALKFWIYFFFSLHPSGAFGFLATLGCFAATLTPFLLVFPPGEWSRADLANMDLSIVVACHPGGRHETTQQTI